MTIASDIQKVFWWVKPTYKAFGFWRGLTTFLVTAALFGWAMIDRLPWSIIAALIYMSAVTTIYLLMIPAMFRTLAGAKPSTLVDFRIYKAVQGFKVFQAACLLAGVSPKMPPPHGVASDWGVALIDALKSGTIERIRNSTDDAMNFFDGTYAPHLGTAISRAELKKFAALHDREPEFLT